MTLPSNYRWVILGSLAIRNRANAPHYAPDFVLADLTNAIASRIATNTGFRSYGKNQRLMWCSRISEDDHFIRILIEVGDKNVAGVSFLNFETHETRDIQKEEEEGGHFSAHVLIRKIPNQLGRHLILIEKVPGVHISSVKDHLTWSCHDHAYEKEEIDDDGNPKRFRAIVTIDGHQSKTIRDALQTGTLQDIEFVSHRENHVDGLDEDPIIQEIVHEARWEVKRRVTEGQARGIFEGVGDFLQHFIGGVDNTQIFVRIKADNGQIKRAEVTHNGEEILEQAFVQNEVVTDFDVPLTQRYEDFRLDMLDKMTQVAATMEG